MKKKLFILAVVSLMVCLIGFVAIASACDDDHDKGKEGKSKIGHLEFYQKCPQIITDPRINVNFCTSGALLPPDPLNPLIPPLLVPPFGDEYLKRIGRSPWGKMEYNLRGPIFKFEFEGHGLEPGKSYTLIYFPEWLAYTWSGELNGLSLIYFGSDIADGHGHVHINGSLDTGDLPFGYDESCVRDVTGRCFGEGSGARIWLVLSSDICIRSTVYQPRMIGWNPASYLFGDTLITFTDKHFDETKPCETNCEDCY